MSVCTLLPAKHFLHFHLYIKSPFPTIPPPGPYQRTVLKPILKLLQTISRESRGQAAASLTHCILFLLLAHTPTEHPTNGAKGARSSGQGLSFFWESRGEWAPHPLPGFLASSTQTQICNSSMFLSTQMRQNCDRRAISAALGGALGDEATLQGQGISLRQFTPLYPLLVSHCAKGKGEDRFIQNINN